MISNIATAGRGGGATIIITCRVCGDQVHVPANTAPALPPSVPGTGAASGGDAVRTLFKCKPGSNHPHRRVLTFLRTNCSPTYTNFERWDRGQGFQHPLSKRAFKVQ